MFFCNNNITIIFVLSHYGFYFLLHNSCICSGLYAYMHCRFLTHLNHTRVRLLAVKRTSWRFQSTAETYSLVPKLNAVCRICLPYFQYIALMPNYVRLCRSKNHRRSWLQFCHIWLPYFYSCCLSSKMVRSTPKLNAKRCSSFVGSTPFCVQLRHGAHHFGTKAA